MVVLVTTPCFGVLNVATGVIRGYYFCVRGERETDASCELGVFRFQCFLILLLRLNLNKHSYTLFLTKLGKTKGGARRALAQTSAPRRSTLRRAFATTNLHPPCLSVRCVGRGTALGAILGLHAHEILKHSKITCSTPPRRRGVAAVGRAAGC